VTVCCEDSKNSSGCREWGRYLDRLSVWKLLQTVL